MMSQLGHQGYVESCISNWANEQYCTYSLWISMFGIKWIVKMSRLLNSMQRNWYIKKKNFKGAPPLTLAVMLCTHVNYWVDLTLVKSIAPNFIHIQVIESYHRNWLICMVEIRHTFTFWEHHTLQRIRYCFCRSWSSVIQLRDGSTTTIQASFRHGVPTWTCNILLILIHASCTSQATWWKVRGLWVSYWKR